MEIDDVKRLSSEIISAMRKAIVGYEREIKHILIALLADGHVLLEGVPGVAKTTMAKGLAQLLGVQKISSKVFRGFSRIQCTPDLMPSDVTGCMIYNQREMRFEPRLGPIFCYLLLVDEINRAIPRTQSALLQAMQEKEVTIGDRVYKLEDRSRGKFFFVMATQNPVEQEGTYPLPEAQLDRFLMRIVVGYPEDLESEKLILRLHSNRIAEPIDDLSEVVQPLWVTEAQEVITREISVSEGALEYITRGIRYTRPEVFEPIGELLILGASPRAGIALLRAAKVSAAIRGDDEVLPEDVDSVLYPVLNHRLLPNPEKLAELRMEGEIFGSQYSVAERAMKLAFDSAKREIGL